MTPAMLRIAELRIVRDKLAIIKLHREDNSILKKIYNNPELDKIVINIISQTVKIFVKIRLFSSLETKIKSKVPDSYSSLNMALIWLVVAIIGNITINEESIVVCTILFINAKEINVIALDSKIVLAMPLKRKNCFI